MLRVLAALALFAAPLAAQPTTPASPPERPVPGQIPSGGGPALPRPAEPAARARPAAGLTRASAVLLSVGATAGVAGLGYALDQREGDNGFGAAVIVSGLLVGPSVGNLAVGNRRGALIGTGIRTLGLALVAGGVATSFMNDSAGDAQAAAIVGGFALGVGGVAYDLISAGRHAGRVTVAPGLDAQTRAPVGVVRVGL